MRRSVLGPPAEKEILYRAERFLAAAGQKIVLIAAIFIALFFFILGLKVLSPKHGLRGRYYANESWDGPPALMTTDPVISFDKKIMSKRSGNIDCSSAIWEGYIFVPKSSTYWFLLNSDDGSWVYLDDTLLIDNGGIHPEIRREKETRLSRGNHRLRIKYFDAGGDGKIDFRWTEKKTPEIAMPGHYFYLQPVSLSVVIWDAVSTFALFLLKGGFIAIGLLLFVLVLGALFPSFRQFSLFERKAAAWSERRLLFLQKIVDVIPVIWMGLFFMILNAKKTVDADIMFFIFVNMHHTSFLDTFFWSVTYLGNGWIMIPIFFVLIFWRIPKNGRMRIIAVAAVVLSSSLICNNVVKHFVLRPRPVVYFSSPSLNTATKEPGAYAVHVVAKRLNNNSFPSGHANMAFTLATLAVLIFGIKFWPAFLVAMGVAYSRMYMGAHFPSDVFAGACMGSVITLIVWYGAARIARKRHPA